MTFSRKTLLMILIIICLVPPLILLGCSKITQENYDQLKVGMDYNEVIKILGEPDNCESVLNMKNCILKESSKRITIKIIADKVIFLSGHGI